ncbi:collagen alpha-1(I) chain-like [Vulpes lagopus]|uniref:collagen alpha-1(I) chain-like n=1 Tax=Vulpes lagopus TaxID=494514 RepID=UPI001BCA1D54|nr:collagen alpha-1(I) chain-like [Vulpes lagopus]
MGEETREHFEGGVPGRRDSAPPHAPGPPLPAAARRPPPAARRPGRASNPRSRARAAGPQPSGGAPGLAGAAGPGGRRGACRVGGARRPLRRPHAGTPARRPPARGRAGQARAGGPAGGRAGRGRNKSAFVERRPPEGHTQWRREPAPPPPPPPPPPPGPPRRPPEPPHRRAPHTYTHTLTGLLRLIEGVRGPRTAPNVGSGLRLCWRQRRLRGSRFAAVAAMLTPRVPPPPPGPERLHAPEFPTLVTGLGALRGRRERHAVSPAASGGLRWGLGAGRWALGAGRWRGGGPRGPLGPALAPALLRKATRLLGGVYRAPKAGKPLGAPRGMSLRPGAQGWAGNKKGWA